MEEIRKPLGVNSFRIIVISPFFEDLLCMAGQNLVLW